jgi:ArsR family transcriptional regulator
MDEIVRARYVARANILKALGHPSRLFIVDELAKGERCVHELTELVGSDQSTVSKHLSILKSAGLVRDVKRGNLVYYSLATICVTNFFSCVESVLQENAQAKIGIV